MVTFVAELPFMIPHKISAGSVIITREERERSGSGKTHTGMKSGLRIQRILIFSTHTHHTYVEV
jgi:hypothetical protein